MSKVQLPENSIERIVPILGGAMHARLKYEGFTDKRSERKVIILFGVETGHLQNIMDEDDEEIIGTVFIPKKLDFFKDQLKESFTADDNTWVDPSTGEIVKYASQAPTEAMENVPYATQYNWFAYISANQPILVDKFIADTIDQKIANNELEIQKYAAHH